jgi:hypothetical protein
MDRKLCHRAHAGLFMERVPLCAAQPIHPGIGTTQWSPSDCAAHKFIPERPFCAKEEGKFVIDTREMGP